MGLNDTQQELPPQIAAQLTPGLGDLLRQSPAPSAPVFDTSAQQPQKNSGGIRGFLTSAFRNFMGGAADAGEEAFGLAEHQSRKVNDAYKVALTDATRNEIEQSKPVTIPDNIADAIGLDRGSQVPKAAFGTVVAAYLRAREKANTPSTANDKQRYMNLVANQKLNIPVTPEDAAWMKGYEQANTLSAVTGAKARGEAMGGIRVKTLYDTKTRSLKGMNANEWNAANTSEPGRYIDPQNSLEWLRASTAAKGVASLAGKVMQAPDGQGGTMTVSVADALRDRLPAVSPLNFERVLNKQVQMDDVVGAFNTVKQYTHVLNNGHNAEISAALADPERTLTQYAQSGVIGNLNDEERNYVVNLLMAREAAGSMRQILGQGQASDMQRRLILSTLPNAATPDKNYADKQLDAALGILKRVAPAVPKGVVNRPNGNAGNTPQSNGGLQIIRDANGRIVGVK